MAINWRPPKQQTGRIDYSGAMNAAQEMFARQTAVYGQMMQELGPRGMAIYAARTGDPAIPQFMRRLGLGDYRNYLTTDPNGEPSLDGMTPQQQASLATYFATLQQRAQVQPQPPQTVMNRLQGQPLPSQQAQTPKAGTPQNTLPQPTVGQQTPPPPPVTAQPVATPAPTPEPAPPAPQPTGDFVPNTSWAGQDSKLQQELLERYNQSIQGTGQPRVMSIDALATRIGEEGLTQLWNQLVEESRDPRMADAERRLGREVGTAVRRAEATDPDRANIWTNPSPEPSGVSIDYYDDDASRAPVESTAIPEGNELLGDIVYAQYTTSPTEDPAAFAAQLDMTLRSYGFNSALEALDAYRAKYGTLPPHSVDAEGNPTPFRGINFITAEQLREIKPTRIEDAPVPARPPRPESTRSFAPLPQTGPPESAPDVRDLLRGEPQSSITRMEGQARAEASQTDARVVRGEGPSGTEPVDRPDNPSAATVQEEAVQSGTTRATVTPPSSDSQSGGLIIANPTGVVLDVDVPPKRNAQNLARAVSELADQTLPEGQRRAAAAEVRRQLTEADTAKALRGAATSEPVVEYVTEWVSGPGNEQFASILNQAADIYAADPARAAAVFGGVFARRLEADSIAASTESTIAQTRQYEALTNRVIEETRQIQRQNEITDEFVRQYGVENLASDQVVAQAVERLQSDLALEFAPQIAKAEAEITTAEGELARVTRRAQIRYQNALSAQLEATVHQMLNNAVPMVAVEGMGEMTMDQWLKWRQLASDENQAQLELISGIVTNDAFDDLFTTDSEMGTVLRQALVEGIFGISTRQEGTGFMNLFGNPQSFRLVPDNGGTSSNPQVQQTAQEVLGAIGSEEVE